MSTVSWSWFRCVKACLLPAEWLVQGPGQRICSENNCTLSPFMAPAHNIALQVLVIMFVFASGFPVPEEKGPGLLSSL